MPHDCGTRSGIWIRRSDNIGGQPISTRLLGRVAAAPVVDPKTGEVIVDRNEEINRGYSRENRTIRNRSDFLALSHDV